MGNTPSFMGNTPSFMGNTPSFMGNAPKLGKPQPGKKDDKKKWLKRI